MDSEQERPNIRPKKKKKKKDKGLWLINKVSKIKSK